jgi:hypothetical protein
VEAEVGYNNRPDNPGAGCGGVCLWVSLLISHMVCEVGKSRSGWARNNTHLTTLEERGAFELLKSTFNVHDLFSLSNSIRYSWDNRRDRENRTMARLDRIYSLREFGEIVVASDYTIMANSAFLDHSPMYRSVKLEVEAQQKSPYVMNACYLKHEAVKERTRKEWASHPILPFFGKLRRCIRDYK